MSSGQAKLIFVVFLVINCILWSNSRYGAIAPSLVKDASSTGRMHTRSISGLLYSLNETVAINKHECAPLLYPTVQQCSHVQNKCVPSRSFLSIQYLEHYFCSPIPARPAIFIGYIIWLIFLFSTLGISASDFFCPNLASIAELLGLDENVAGVTFLAFGNGSPDVFSTFSAMRADSGSLAIGELLGAASFIVSVVVGSMCIVKPFRVHKAPFLRDVGFFAVAVGLLLFILWDSLILPWEAAVLVVLYLAYVGYVIGGTWWENRCRRLRQSEDVARGEYRDEELPEALSPIFEESYRDNVSESSEATATLAPSQSLKRQRAISHPGPPPRLGIDTSLPPRAHSRTPSPSPRPDYNQMPSFSLVGALEFRQVVSSLHLQSANSALSMFESPSPFPGGHYHRHSSSRISSHRNSVHDQERDPWDTALAGSHRQHSRVGSGHRNSVIDPEHGNWDSTLGVPLNERTSPRLQRDRLMAPDLSHVSSGLADISDDESRTTLPTFVRTPASPSSEASLDMESRSYDGPPSRRRRIIEGIKLSYHILFPTLHNIRTKSYMGIIASVLAAPAVFALTITLPVYVHQRGGNETREKHMHHAEERLIDFEEEDGVERLLTAEEDVEEHMHDLQFNKWLMAAQCALGPLFCAMVLFAGNKHQIWLLLATAIAGVTVAILVAVFADKGNNAAIRMARCFMGFFVAVVWIMAIADEVVGVLKTFGFIFGLSDAIIGLTIFAVGNSLADFVANLSVATFAPIMGFSACFGGPMLNILLGVGISGTYIMRVTGEPYPLHFSDTLLVSTIGLLAVLLVTVIFVPWNDYMLTKRWGIFLILFYVVIMAINVVVEVMR